MSSTRRLPGVAGQPSELYLWGGITACLGCVMVPLVTRYLAETFQLPASKQSRASTCRPIR